MRRSPVTALIGLAQQSPPVPLAGGEVVPAGLQALYDSSPLHYELTRRHYDHALQAMPLTPDLDAIEETTGTTALGLASKDGSADAIDLVKPLIIQYRADPRIVDDHGYTALHYTAYSGNYAVAETLANHGAEIDAVNELVEEKVPAAPLFIAYRYGRTRIAEFLKFRGAEDFDPELIKYTKFSGALLAPCWRRGGRTATRS